MTSNGEKWKSGTKKVGPNNEIYGADNDEENRLTRTLMAHNKDV